MNKEKKKIAVLDDYGAVLTVQEVAAILRIGKNAAYALVHEGAVPSVRVGRKYLVPKNCIFDFLKAAPYNNRVD
ncbi:MAG: helix-turn-helix domain-containing protein [Clostridiales bacterium]|jgi:excisionase family DNA binding protein|nr:helix-turn-helix domain-containing protein [Clostridiales bacterium]